MRIEDLPFALTVPEFTEHLRKGSGTWTTYEAVRTGQIKALRWGRKILIPRSELARLIGEPVGEGDEDEPATRVAGVPLTLVEGDASA